MQSPGTWKAKLRLGPSPSQPRTAAQVPTQHRAILDMCCICHYLSNTGNADQGACDKEGMRQASRRSRRACAASKGLTEAA